MKESDLIKKYGSSVIADRGEVKYVSTWFKSIDYLIGWWIPLGRYVEIAWPNGSGKTTLGMHCAKQFDILGMKTAFIDMEKTYPYHLDKLLWFKHLDVFTPTCWEDAWDLMQELISDWYKLIVWDSVAATRPNSLIENWASDNGVGKHSNLIQKIINITTNALSSNWATMICINQLRKGVWPYIPEHTTWWTQLTYACSVRLKIKAIQVPDNLKKDWDVILKPSEVEVVKSKHSYKNLNKATVYLDREGKFDSTMDIMIEALDKGILTKSGAFIKYNGDTLGQWLLLTVKRFKYDKTWLLDKISKQLDDVLDLNKLLHKLALWTKDKVIAYNKLVDKYNIKWDLELEHFSIEDVEEYEFKLTVKSKESNKWTSSENINPGIVETISEDTLDLWVWYSKEEFERLSWKDRTTIYRWIKSGKVEIKENLYFLIKE